MFKQHKTFDFDKERVLNQPKRERFYEPTKCRYSMFFVIPILIGFILLCILVNVDFTGEAYNNLKIYNQEEEYNNEEQMTSEKSRDFLESTIEVEQENSQTMEWKAKPTTKTSFNRYILTNLEESDKTKKSLQKIKAFLELQRNILRDQDTSNETNESIELEQMNKESSSEQEPTKEFYTNRIAGEPKCSKTSTNCSLYCRDGNVNFIDDHLESLAYMCPNTDYSLLVQNCEFYNGIFSSGWLSGYHTLIYLEISDSNLQTIQKNAFKATAMKTLKTLILRNNMITTLTATTFEGATLLKYFEFLQQPLPNAFQAEQFLQPMASNLNEALISQEMAIGVVLNPKTWLQGSELNSLLKLNIANNNFQDILDSSTFRTLIKIENLILSNCSLLTIPEKTFDIILNTLKYLDLRGNYLQTLDLQLLNNVVSFQIEMDLSSNKWYCDCDYPDLIEFLRANTQLIETVVCSEPEKWQNVALKEVLNECVDAITTPTTTTEDSTTLSSTTLSSTISTLTTQLTTITSTLEIDDDDDNITTTGSPTELTTTTEISTITNTVLPNTTTEISQSSTIPTNYISVICYDVNKTETIYWFQRNDFFIYTTSSSSVTIQMHERVNKTINIIYFTNSKAYKNLTKNITDKTNNVSVYGLTYDTTYVFCLTSTNQYTISPFDCQAHYVALFIESWLGTEDKTWFIWVITISSLFFIAASILGVYWTLRKHPIWLVNRNERILRVNNSKQQVILISGKKSNRKATESTSSSYLTAQQYIKHENNDDNDDILLYSTQHTVPTNRPPNIPGQKDNRKSSCPSYGTAQNCSLASKYISVHFNRFHNPDADASSLYTSKHTVPTERAPYKPKQKAGEHRISTTPLYTNYEQITSDSEINFNGFQSFDDDTEYQTIDHYEVVNF